MGGKASLRRGGTSLLNYAGQGHTISDEVGLSRSAFVGLQDSGSQRLAAGPWILFKACAMESSVNCYSGGRTMTNGT